MAVATLRPALPADDSFLRDVYFAARAPEFDLAGFAPAVLRALLDDQYTLQEAGYRRTFPDLVTFVILCDGVDAGRVIQGPHDGALRLADIAVLPAFRGRGLATQVIERLQAEAKAASMPIHLQVDIGSRARDLYERLHFVETGRNELRHQLTWSPK